MSSRGTFPGLPRARLHALVGGAGRVPEVRSYKVRDIVDLDDRLLVVTSDRVSAFDRVLTTIPCKGQVLNQLSAFWFRHTADIVANHLLREVTPRSMLVRRCSMLPVEVVVRGYLTGSAWRDYQRDGAVSGIRLPAGMRADERFPAPLLTPSTKPPPGEHDRPLPREELLAGGVVDGGLWERIEAVALQLYRRGVELAARSGLILVDTKYEFGTVGGELLLADEVHTPDSSRYWYGGEYAERFADGRPQRQLDKEFLRAWLMQRGYMGDGAPPEIPDDVRDGLGARYREAFRLLTGAELVPSALTEQDELAAYANLVRAVSAGD
ncbi:MAG: phosphoribosylaminoimidazolesuccinocarboxamide synthase [Spirochaetaceae bacterium]|nr:phosphoribosylaminoimidazolesuccinocarboxamide synthase [Spirochaetaceae bacterium]